MSFLFSKTINKNYKKDLPKIKLRLIINSFTGNTNELKQSLQMQQILENYYQIKDLSIFDINQELVFDKSKKVNSNIREYFYNEGVLFMVNNKFLIPQLILNENTVLSFEEFILLHESQILFRILNNINCFHFRIFKNEVVYFKDKYNDCIYCYSEKKQKQSVIVYLDKSNHLNVENNDILTFLEDNEITMNVIDIKNNKSKDNLNKEKGVLIKEKFYLFTEAKELIKKNKSNMLNTEGLINSQSFYLEQKENNNYKIKQKRNYNLYNKNNPYNFIFKLQLHNKRNNYSLTEINTNNLLDYSFQN